MARGSIVAMDAADLLDRYARPVPRYTSYPTAPHFAPLNDAAYREWLAAIPPDSEVSLYLHVPFCRALCLFCGCHTTIVNHAAPVVAYAATLREEIALVAAAIGRRLTVRHLHWGGGTPTIMGAELAATMAVLRQSFDIAADAEIAVEIDPRTLSAAMVETLAESGVTRASLGVQDFDPLVQQAVRRIQSFDTVAAAADALRAAGIAAINFDLMYGLPHQTVAGAAATATRALNLAPDRLAVFSYAHVPWMKRHQALLPEAALPDAEIRFAQQQAMAEVLGNADYVAVGLDHFARPDDPLAIAAAARRLRRNFQGYTTDTASVLLGFGASAIGALPDAYMQNAAAVPQWRAAVRDGRLPVVRGLLLSAEDRARRAIIEQLMCHFAAELDPAMPTPAEMAEFTANGLVEYNATRLQVTPAGRPFVRTIAAAFDAYYQRRPEAPRHSIGV